MFNFSIPDAAIGSVAAAVVAAMVAFLGLVISKESKVSEFRQAWIDELRADLAALITNANLIRGAAGLSYESKKQAFESVSDFFLDFNRAASSIRLRLNPTERRCVAVLKAIEELEGTMAASPIDVDACVKNELVLLRVAQKLLKIEWGRVRRGEFVFVCSKWVIGLSTASLVIGLMFTWWAAPVPSPTPAAVSATPAQK